MLQHGEPSWAQLWTRDVLRDVVLVANGTSFFPIKRQAIKKGEGPFW
jgi:hypothetical protein